MLAVPGGGLRGAADADAVLAVRAGGACRGRGAGGAVQRRQRGDLRAAVPGRPVAELPAAAAGAAAARGVPAGAARPRAGGVSAPGGGLSGQPRHDGQPARVAGRGAGAARGTLCARRAGRARRARLARERRADGAAGRACRAPDAGVPAPRRLAAPGRVRPRRADGEARLQRRDVDRDPRDREGAGGGRRDAALRRPPAGSARASQRGRSRPLRPLASSATRTGGCSRSSRAATTSWR